MNSAQNNLLNMNTIVSKNISTQHYHQQKLSLDEKDIQDMQDNEKQTNDQTNPMVDGQKKKKKKNKKKKKMSISMDQHEQIMQNTKITNQPADQILQTTKIQNLIIHTEHLKAKPQIQSFRNRQVFEVKRSLFNQDTQRQAKNIQVVKQNQQAKNGFMKHQKLQNQGQVSQKQIKAISNMFEQFFKVQNLKKRESKNLEFKQRERDFVNLNLRNEDQVNSQTQYNNPYNPFDANRQMQSSSGFNTFNNQNIQKQINASLIGMNDFSSISLQDLQDFNQHSKTNGIQNSNRVSFEFQPLNSKTFIDSSQSQLFFKNKQEYLEPQFFLMNKQIQHQSSISQHQPKIQKKYDSNAKLQQSQLYMNKSVQMNSMLNTNGSKYTTAYQQDKQHMFSSQIQNQQQTISQFLQPKQVMSYMLMSKYLNNKSVKKSPNSNKLISAQQNIQSNLINSQSSHSQRIPRKEIIPLHISKFLYNMSQLTSKQASQEGTSIHKANAQKLGLVNHCIQTPFFNPIYTPNKTVHKLDLLKQEVVVSCQLSEHSYYKQPMNKIQNERNIKIFEEVSVQNNNISQSGNQNNLQISVHEAQFQIPSNQSKRLNTFTPIEVELQRIHLQFNLFNRDNILPIDNLSYNPQFQTIETVSNNLINEMEKQEEDRWIQDVMLHRQQMWRNALGINRNALKQAEVIQPYYGGTMHSIPALQQKHSFIKLNQPIKTKSNSPVKYESAYKSRSSNIVSPQQILLAKKSPLKIPIIPSNSANAYNQHINRFQNELAYDSLSKNPSDQICKTEHYYNQEIQKIREYYQQLHESEKFYKTEQFISKGNINIQTIQQINEQNSRQQLNPSVKSYQNLHQIKEKSKPCLGTLPLTNSFNSIQSFGQKQVFSQRNFSNQFVSNQNGLMTFRNNQLQKNPSQYTYSYMKQLNQISPVKTNQQIQQLSSIYQNTANKSNFNLRDQPISNYTNLNTEIYRNPYQRQDLQIQDKFKKPKKQQNNILNNLIPGRQTFNPISTADINDFQVQKYISQNNQINTNTKCVDKQQKSNEVQSTIKSQRKIPANVKRMTLTLNNTVNTSLNDKPILINNLIKQPLMNAFLLNTSHMGSFMMNNAIRNYTEAHQQNKPFSNTKKSLQSSPVKFTYTNRSQFSVQKHQKLIDNVKAQLSSKKKVTLKKGQRSSKKLSINQVATNRKIQQPLTQATQKHQPLIQAISRISQRKQIELRNLVRSRITQRSNQKTSIFCASPNHANIHRQGNKQNSQSIENHTFFDQQKTSIQSAKLRVTRLTNERTGNFSGQKSIRQSQKQSKSPKKHLERWNEGLSELKSSRRSNGSQSPRIFNQSQRGSAQKIVGITKWNQNLSRFKQQRSKSKQSRINSNSKITQNNYKQQSMDSSMYNQPRNLNIQIKKYKHQISNIQKLYL